MREAARVRVLVLRACGMPSRLAARGRLNAGGRRCGGTRLRQPALGPHATHTCPPLSGGGLTPGQCRSRCPASPAPSWPPPWTAPRCRRTAPALRRAQQGAGTRVSCPSPGRRGSGGGGRGAASARRRQGGCSSISRRSVIRTALIAPSERRGPRGRGPSGGCSSSTCQRRAFFTACSTDHRARSHAPPATHLPGAAPCCTAPLNCRCFCSSDAVRRAESVGRGGESRGMRSQQWGGAFGPREDGSTSEVRR